MSEMSERVAAVIKAKLQEYGMDLNNIDVSPSIARAVIAAMREPTQAMLDASFKGVGYADNDERLEVWHDMIDEALS